MPISRFGRDRLGNGVTCKATQTEREAGLTDIALPNIVTVQDLSRQQAKQVAWRHRHIGLS